MSTTIDNTQLEDDFTPPPARPGGNLRFINIASGAMSEWQKGGDNLPVPDNVVVGYLERVNIYTNEVLNSEKLEVELKNPAEGTYIVGISTENSVGSGNLMDFILNCKEGDLISIRSNASKDKNKFGHYTTFINGHVKVKGMWSEHKSVKPDGVSWKEYIADSLRDEFCKLPFFRARPGKEEEGEYHWFKQEVLAKGWLSVDGNEDAYLTWVNRSTNQNYTVLSDVEDDDWNELRQLVKMAKKEPKELA